MRLARLLGSSFALLCVVTYASPARIVGPNADSIPNDSWVDIYFRLFDPAAKAAGLAPLRETTLPTGDREVRIWTLGLWSLPDPSTLPRTTEEAWTVGRWSSSFATGRAAGLLTYAHARS